jgi:hypothetical protein
VRVTVAAARTLPLCTCCVATVANNDLALLLLLLLLLHVTGSRVWELIHYLALFHLRSGTISHQGFYAENAHVLAVLFMHVQLCTAHKRH